MSTYRTAGHTTPRDSGNGSRGSGIKGSSSLAVIDADGRYVAMYERNEASWGGASCLAWFLDAETGKRMAYHSVPTGSEAKTLRSWFKGEAAERYGVRFGR